MKSISPVVATILLLLMTVAAAGVAYLTFSSYQSSTQSASEGGISQFTQLSPTRVRLESISGGNLYIRSAEGQLCEDLYVKVGNNPRNCWETATRQSTSSPSPESTAPLANLSSWSSWPKAFRP